ncbi:MAG: fructose 1,6-bisphosphatase [Candidatus Korarchaeota archaeon]|nr:fructose 1,6-bisphosphatase [Candidatus Korarchaeota archaeon]
MGVCNMKITVSLIKADVGGWPGHVRVHPRLIEAAKKKLSEAKNNGIIIDYHVFNAGDDLQLLMTHRKGTDSPEIHELAWNTFKEATQVAKKLKLYGAGQDLLSETFSGNLKGMGPGIAEMEFEERPSEPIVVFAADKTEPGAFNLPIFRIFADPFNTAGLVISPTMNLGFKFSIMDVYEGNIIDLNSPEEMYYILALIGQPGRFVIKYVYSRKEEIGIAAAVSTDRLNLIAGKYVGKDDPVAIIRGQHGLPAIGEITEPFAFPHLVAGWMRGSHHGPLMPVPLKYSQCTRFDGPPRIVGLGFQLAEGHLIGPVDLFDDPAFDLARKKANEIADYLRRHGPFEPHRLSAEEMEYTALPQVLDKIKNRWRKVAPKAKKAWAFGSLTD